MYLFKSFPIVIFSRQFLFLFTFVFIAFGTFSQNRIKINIPTASTETDYIWRTIRDITFFEKHNYELSLPRTPLIESLKEKARSNQLTDEDYEKLESLMKTHVYKEEDYLQGAETINEQVALITKMVTSISQSKRNWHFKEFETYQINLTLYGSGGSYDPDNGTITLFTTPNGQFKNYDNPANTIIHEIVHIGMEASIMQKYAVPHTMKERIIDQFVSLNFQNLLPDYRIQNMGDNRIDPYLTDKESLTNLSEHVLEILNKN